MAILEVCKRILKDGVLPSDPTLLKVLPAVREATETGYVYQASIEDAKIFYMFGMWPSMSAYESFWASPERTSVLEPLDSLSDIEWIEHMEHDSLSSLPTLAPCMTVTRAFLKGGDNPKEYYRKISDLKEPIYEETKPWQVIYSWTVDTVPEKHKWLMFVGWKSKKHHREYAAWLRRNGDTFPEFPGIPEHYDEGTAHSHTWNMESGPPTWSDC